MAGENQYPSLPLAGKLAVVTGASRGLGAGIAMELARRGASVVLGYTSEGSASRVAGLAEQIEALPHKPRAHGVRGNLAEPRAAQEIVSDLRAWAGGDLKVDILVNNAGTERVKSLAEIELEDYHAVFDLNVRGIILLTQALLPYLNARARIINLGSVGARAGFKSMSLYCASKAALEGLTRCWAAELGANGTTVNCINPGPVQSDMLDNIPKEIVDMQKAQTPIQNRLGTTQEIADIVSSLAGNDSAWITGQTISASGGWAMY